MSLATASYLARRAAQKERVRTLYRRALKDTLNWAVHRHLFYHDADALREKFESNRQVNEDMALQEDIELIDKMITAGEESYNKWRHPDPYIVPWAPGGTKFCRNPTPPAGAFYERLLSCTAIRGIRCTFLNIKEPICSIREQARLQTQFLSNKLIERIRFGKKKLELEFSKSKLHLTQCGNNTECINMNTGRGYTCKCLHGFKGNPYLLEGCKDIDECANHKDYNYPLQTHCVNTKESYLCVLNGERKRMLDLLIASLGVAVGILILVAFGIWIWRNLKKMKVRKTKRRFFKKTWGLLLEQQYG
ncbi:hypothetical protein OROMI_032100 [Orobanche minor]